MSFRFIPLLRGQILFGFGSALAMSVTIGAVSVQAKPATSPFSPTGNFSQLKSTRPATNEIPKTTSPTPSPIPVKGERSQPTPTPVPAAMPTSPAIPTAQVTPCTPSGNSATNLVVCTASYLGGTSNDTAAAVEVAPDRSVVIAGTLVGTTLNLRPIYLQVTGSPAQGNGSILRMDATGGTVLSMTRLGNTIDDMDINRTTGNIAVAGDFGVAMLNPQANRVLWSQNQGVGGGASFSTGRRVAVGNGGQVATLFNKQVQVFDAAGRRLGQFSPGGSFVEDIAVDSASGSVIVTGYTQKNGGGCSQLQVAFVRSFSYTGVAKWTNYDWSHAQAFGAQSSCADSRGARVAIGRDNMLYFAGESAGGNSIFRFNPRNLSLAAPNVKYDAYTDPYNTKSNHITYYTKLVPSTGNIVAGQFLLARLKAGGGNTIRPRAITADEQGNVYVAGASAAAIANRNPVNLSISGQAIGNYSGGDGFLLIVSPNLRNRYIWTAWTGVNPTSVGTTIMGVAVSQGVAAMVATSNGNMILVDPLQLNNQGGSDIFFSVFPARTN
ncbi:MAG: SBBP repeat-containing protein [Scytolyngbya sp. HA4215-MV1]|nr:SBBP repeat-containing protein [Scytolyngbya sp. HA4215-MV1]